MIKVLGFMTMSDYHVTGSLIFKEFGDPVALLSNHLGLIKELHCLCSSHVQLFRDDQGVALRQYYQMPSRWYSHLQVFRGPSFSLVQLFSDDQKFAFPLFLPSPTIYLLSRDCAASVL